MISTVPIRRFTTVAAVILATALITMSCSGSDVTGGVVPDASAVTLLDVQTQVFSDSCALSGCHRGSGAPFGLDLSSATSSTANLVGVPSAEQPDLLRVDPGNAVNSYVFMKVTADPRISGDPMPLDGSPLTAAQRALIETWINEGAR